ncbi:hypothetical protein CEXT_638131 [Caerostris extrusa]|uniref:Uncharacterized protein n=1 Tax=Caerostris extrusa TaxID=172846 RepID=A0AAV4Q0W3_CAEEX|nr:hypothetical protein CEXT_638131 [Caerostris extrusa]
MELMNHWSNVNTFYILPPTFPQPRNPRALRDNPLRAWECQIPFSSLLPKPCFDLLALHLKMELMTQWSNVNTFYILPLTAKKSSCSPGQSPQGLGMSDFIQFPFTKALL